MSTKLFDLGDENVLYIVDLSSYLLRAYHAVAPLSSPQGEPTHAVHGTITMLERLFRGRKPQLLSICMDAGRQTFRKEMYADYKANRPPAPDDLRVQIQRTEEIVRSWGVQVLKQVGVEADDLIASLTLRAQEEGYSVVIVSADKDLMQLVTPQVVMWDTLRNRIFGEAEVEEKFKVKPSQLGDLLALMGDSSDNIPGVPSVGPKTAATLLQDYGDLDGVYNSLDCIKRKKLKQTLIDHEDEARMSRRLVALKEDCPVDASREALAFAPKARRKEGELAKIYESLGFTKQLAALKNGEAIIQQGDPQDDSTNDKTTTPSLSDKAPNNPSNDEPLGAAVSPLAKADNGDSVQIKVIQSSEDLNQLIALLGTGTWALEPLTLRPDHHRGPIIALTLCREGEFFYIPFEHRYIGAPEQLSGAECTSSVLKALESGSAEVLVHDLKRCLVIFQESNLDTALTKTFDTLLGAYLIAPERRHTISTIGASVQLVIADYDHFAKEGRRKKTWDELEISDASAYAAQRSLAILRSAGLQKTKLVEEKLDDLFRNVELPLARLLAELEVRGVLVDVSQLAHLGETCAAELQVLEKSAHESAGKEFNVHAPRQLEGILFDELGLKPIKRTKTARSTDAQTLEALSEEHALPGIIIKLRQIAKLKSTYIDALPTMVREETGRIHGAWEQAITATGRLSSADPNLQNIPIRSELGRQIRQAFVAPPGHQIVSADYSQIELRVLAHLSQDVRLIEAFQTDMDVHARTAMEIFEVQEDQVTREMRARAKAVNFGVIYGQGDNALAKSLGIERKEAAHFISMYFQRYDGVRTFMDNMLEEARTGTSVHSLLGRRRVIPDIKSGHRGRRLAAERIAMNMPIQGSAADILKLAMLKLATPVTPGTKMVLTVHDELVFEVPDAELDEACPLIQSAMEGAHSLIVPLKVDLGRGPNWNSAH